jgi:hypothetical protein
MPLWLGIMDVLETIRDAIAGQAQSDGLSSTSQRRA